MYDLILEIAAFLVCVFCLVVRLRKRIKHIEYTPENLLDMLKNTGNLSFWLMICLLISSGSDALNYFIETYVPGRSASVVDALGELYFIVHTFLPPLFVLFIISITDAFTKKGEKFFALFFIPFFIEEIIIITNPLTRIIYRVDENALYVRGPFIWLLYALSGIYVITGMVFFSRYRKKLSDIDRLIMFVILFITTVGMILQGVLSIKVELFFDSVGLLCFILLLKKGDPQTAGHDNRKVGKDFIAVISLLFTTIIIINIAIIYNSGAEQTDKIGDVQISNLKGELQHTLSEFENKLLRYSMGLEQLINDNADTAEIEKYVRAQEEYYCNFADSCFSVYAASSEWTVIPDFDMPEEYHAVERVWYIGAKHTPGDVYISEPYIDADTGDLCYTFSYLLSDGDTVAAMDYRLSDVQEIVGKMGGNDDQFAMIVTDSGIIIGCSDEQYQGEDLTNVLNQYTEVFERVKASKEHKNFNIRIDSDKKIVFDSETDNGWKLILIVDYNEFYAGLLSQIIMLGTIDFMLMTVIISFYLMSLFNQEKAEKTLASTENFIARLSGDIKIPLQEIIGTSDNLLRHDSIDHKSSAREILDAGKLLQERLDNLFSYSNILKDDEKKQNSQDNKKDKHNSFSNSYVRNGIIIVIVTSFAIGLTLCVIMSSNWGYERISKEADRYNSEVTLWMKQKQSILGMFSDVIAADPSVLDDYDAAVKWLDDIAKNYNEMTFAYMANPYNTEHAIIMNNGWVPDPDYKVEERQWYIDTERSGDGYSISAPYFDAQTGLYCITFSRSVYSDDGEFLGIFAIDCLLDKLIDVLDNSYTSDSYAFMVDQDGTIINHPFKEYEITEQNSVNIEDTEYADAYHRGNAFLMRDSGGRLAACYTTKSELSGFTVVVVQSWWSIYGPVLVVALIFFVMLLVSIAGIMTMINRFIKWQDEANKKLSDTAIKAVAAEKAKSRFLAQMSHEIRTPINAVLGMNEMILRETTDASVREYSENIHSASKNLLGLINTILDFSKIEEGKMEIIPAKYNTAEMIENIINSIVKRASDKGLAFEAHIDNNLPSALYGDDMRVSQVVINLLTNAVKYTKEGRVDLYISGTVSDDILNLRVSVKDTGIGIKQEDLCHLFESFTRLEENRNRTIEGTGLGMAIVNRLLDMMGSKLEVHSVYGEGSEFSFEVKQDIIDRNPIGNYAEKAKEAIESEEKTTHLYAPDAKILLVDDNEMNLKVARYLLKLNGIAPDTVLSGALAIEKMKENTYDLIMLDHMMPEMDGIETLQKAKELNLTNGCPVIALTANAVVGARESYIDAGFDDYLSKPIEIANLEGILKQYLPKEKLSAKDSTS